MNYTDVLDAHGVRATAAVNSDLVRKRRSAVDEAKARGWELIAHGVSSSVVHHVGMDEGEERALIAEAIAPPVREYAIAAHRSVEPGHTAILEHLRLEPLLDLGLRLGEGSGAALGMTRLEFDRCGVGVVRDFCTERVAVQMDRAKISQVMVNVFTNACHAMRSGGTLLIDTRDLTLGAVRCPNNPGEKTGALVSAQFGKGRWAYIGLGLWRELPAGVPGAYQLLANLLSVKGS